MEAVDIRMLDITAPDNGVQIFTSADAKTLWVNVDGVCVCRICRIPVLFIEHPDGQVFNWAADWDKGEKNEHGK